MKGEFKALSSTSTAHFSNDGIFFLFSALIVYYSAPPLNLNVLILGYFASIYTLISGLLSLPVGKWSDSGDRDPELMTLGILVLGISLIIFSIPFFLGSSPGMLVNYTLVGIGAFALGFGQAFYHPLGANILRYSLRGMDSSFLLGINGSFGSLGRAVLFFIAGIMIIDLGAFRGLFLLSFYYFAISIFIYYTSKDLRKAGKGIKVNKERQKSVMTPISSFKGVIPFLGILVATMFLRSAFQLAISIYIFKFIDDTFRNGFLSYLFLLIALIAPILGQPLFGHITRKIGGNLTLLIAGIISLFSFIPFLIFSNYYILALLFFAIYVFAAFTGFPSLLGFINQKIPREISTRANTWVWGIGNTVGGAVGIMLFTLISEVYNLNLKSTFEIMLTFLAVSIVTNLFIEHYSKKLKSQITV